jgi:glyoxylase-like metal-dependent hydrolase (beta-lactamase superfamily II)/rhodanese-related sulfurtransferase
MYFKQFYLACLAHASYLIGSNGEAAVVDPQRDIDQYLTEAAEQGLTIKYVIETHLHADFVSGHTELADRTGAKIVFGSNANTVFSSLAVKDQDEIKLGTVILKFIETPGHTPESISILVTDTAESNQPQKVLTGDTMFIGDVGRPDLVGSKGISAEQMAGMLYDSLHEKLLRLSDDVEVYPAHGAGSLCGRNISSETTSTIGEQRRFNYALKPMPKSEFVRMMTADLPEAPSYFSRDAEINRTGTGSLDELRQTRGLGAEEVARLADTALLLDVRSASAFGAGHIRGSMNIGLAGKFASWAGALIPTGKQIVLVADNPADVDEAVVRLARVGIENVAGFLSDGIYAWDRAGLPLSTIAQIPVDELRDRISEASRPGNELPGDLLQVQRAQVDRVSENRLQLIDVRGPGEYAGGHVPGAVNLALPRLMDRIDQLAKDSPVAIVCASGYRSSIATSLLERHGFSELYNVVGGTNAWASAGYELE